CAFALASAAPGAPCATCVALKHIADSELRAPCRSADGTFLPAGCGQSLESRFQARPRAGPRGAPAAALRAYESCYSHWRTRKTPPATQAEGPSGAIPGNFPRKPDGLPHARLIAD